MLRFTSAHILLVTFAAASALITSCGGRVELRGDPSGSTSAGAGGSVSAPTPTGATSSGTSIGAGGSPSACAELVLSGEPITYAPTPFEHGSRPSLVPASDDGALVSVAFSREPVEAPAATVRIASVTLSPWGTWPESLGPDFQVSTFGGDPFAVAPAMPSGQPGFSVLFYLPTNSFPSDMYLSPVVATETSYAPFPTGVSWDAWEPAWTVALARGTSGHLAAYQLGIGPSAYLTLALIDAASPGVEIFDEIACASAPFTADAVPTEGGFLVATASGRHFGACPLDDGVPGPASELQVMRLDQAAKHISLTASFEGVDPIARIALAKRSLGAWLVWQGTGASAEAPPPIQAVLLDESGEVAGPVALITHDGETTGPFAAAALGTHLAVAWIDSLDPSSPNIRLDVFDETGTFVTGTALNTSPAWLYGASLSLLPSPDGTHLLLAWSDENLSAPATVRVARFSCAAGL